MEIATNKDGYLVFNGLTMNQQLAQQLDNSRVFTDQRYQGSYISGINQTLSYVFSTLMLYLNQTSNDSMFTESQLYENMNRIVKQLGYAPVGYQTAVLPFSLSVFGLPVGIYTIPKYSYVNVGGIGYSFNEDITFAKKVDDDLEELVEVSNDKLLYQGLFAEHPPIFAQGTSNEVHYIIPTSTAKIDHFNIHVYVNHDGVWEQWHPTTSLYMHEANDARYEIRLNHNKSYELQFGNNINGRALAQGDEIAVYYLLSDGESGQIGAGALANQRMALFDTNKLRTIRAATTQGQFTSLTNQQMQTSLVFTNQYGSTYASDGEDADAMRRNAPGMFRSQFRLVTEGDYESFVRTNFANVVQDVAVVNNTRYTDEYLKYFYDLGLTNSLSTSRALFNQVQYADACNFNNMYVFLLPKTGAGSLGIAPLPAALGEMVRTTMQEEKIATAETVISDPVFIAFDIMCPTASSPALTDRSTSQLVLVEASNSRRDPNSIKQQAIDILSAYFNRQNTPLGQLVDVSSLGSQLLAIQGVKSIETRNTSNGSVVKGLSLVAWNPAYPTDITQVVENLQLPFFEVAYWYDAARLQTAIVVQPSTAAYEQVEG